MTNVGVICLILFVSIEPKVLVLGVPSLILPFVLFPVWLLIRGGPCNKEIKDVATQAEQFNFAKRYFYALSSFFVSLLVIHSILGYQPFYDGLRLGISLFTGYMLYVIVRWLVFRGKLKPRILFTAILILVLLELYTPFQQFVYQFADLVHGGDREHKAVSRELGLVADRRPLMFMAEPSDVAKTVLLVSTIFAIIHISDVARRITSLDFILFGSLIILVASPVGLAALVMLASPFFLMKKGENFKVKQIITLIPIFGVVSFFGWELLGSQRFEGIHWSSVEVIREPINSAVIRLVVPFVVMKDVLLSEAGFFGLGLNADRFVHRVSALASYVPSYAILGNNSIARIFISFGFFGIFLLLLLVQLISRFFGNRSMRFVSLLYLLILSFTTGSITSYLFWHHFFILLGCVHGLHARSEMHLGSCNVSRGCRRGAPKDA